MAAFPSQGQAASELLKSLRQKSHLPFLSGSNKEEDETRFKVVDDFSSKDFKNKIGGGWRVESSSGSSLDMLYAEEEAINRYGYALKVVYNLTKDGSAFLEGDLNGLDISQAKGLSLWFSYSVHSKAKIEIRLTDNKGVSKAVMLNDFLSDGSKNWQEVSLPLKKWRGLNLDNLKTLQLRVFAKEAEEGAFLLDQIFFWGEEDVFFDSLKDNLDGFPKMSGPDRDKLLELKDETLLERIAKDTWKYFDNIVDRRTNLPLDRIKLSWKKEIGDYTSPTNIGLYFISVVSAHEMGFISRAQAVHRIDSSLKTVEKLAKWKGFLYNFYSTTNLQVTSTFVSTVDNGWFAVALMVVKASFPKELGAAAEGFLSKMDFYELYDPGEGKFHLGYDERTKRFSNSHYGLIASEARLTSFVAMAKKDVEFEHWFRMFRTLPKKWGWQNQVPEGRKKKKDDLRYFGGYYTYEGKKIVPSWGGSLFEFLMPTMVLDEEKYAPESLGENNRVAAEIHRDYALIKKRYPVWGISPCMADRGVHGVYLELGIKDIAAKGYRDAGVVAPYASFLAIDILPNDVLLNIRRFLDFYDVYGDYGFYDSVSLTKAAVTKQYLALDQAMILISITNYLKHGIIRDKFHELEEVKQTVPLLNEEKFFKKQ